MTAQRRSAELGMVAAVAVVLLVLVPYAVADPRAVWVYYAGLLGPPLAGLFAAVAAIAFLAAARERTDPASAAGVVVVLAVLTLGLIAPWAVGVSPALVGGMTTVAAFEDHRWALVVGALALLGAGGWFARTSL